VDYIFNWQLVFSYMPMYALGALIALAMAMLSLGIGSIIGLGAAGLARMGLAPVNIAIRCYVEIMRNVPILLWAYIAFYGLPSLGIHFLNNWTSFVAALSIYAGAYLTEVFRSGLGAIPHRYQEAGRAIGLRASQRIRLVTLPLMFRIVLPPLSNTFISLFKDTSIAAALAVPEITYAAEFVNTNTFRIIEAWAIASVIYLVLGYGLALLFRAGERRYRMVT
jgi:polar amino acid transport system permease protein